MEEVYIEKCQCYLLENFPDLFDELTDRKALNDSLSKALAGFRERTEEYIAGKVSAEKIMEECFFQWLLTLPPSKYRYLCNILRTVFRQDYKQLMDSGKLRTELLHLITFCDPVFEGLGFLKDDGNYYLKYSIMGTVDDYFKDSVPAR